MSTAQRGVAEAAPAKPPAIPLTFSIEATWVVACGALAAGLTDWQEIHALRLLTVWLVADVVLGHLVAHLLAIKASWAPLGSDKARARRAFSPGPLWPHARPHALSAATSGVMALTLATYVGPQALLVAAVALAGLALATLVAGSNLALAGRWTAGLRLGAAWLLGHTALLPASQLSLGLAALVGLATYARLRLSDGRPSSWWLLRWAWVMLALVAIQVQQPVVVAVVTVSALAEIVTEGHVTPVWAQRPLHLRQPVGWFMSIGLLAVVLARWP